MKTISELKQETTQYLKENDWLTSEFDMSINDISRAKIEAMKKEYGSCWIGKINLYGEERNKPKLTEWTGQKIYNFDCSFCIPCYDKELEDMIDKRDKSKYTGTKNDMAVIKQIGDRIDALNGLNLFWA